MGAMESPLFLGCFGPIQLMLSGNEMCFKVWMSYWTIARSLLPLSVLKSMSRLCSVAIEPILFKVGGNRDMHNILHYFDLAAFERLKTISVLFSVSIGLIDLILFKLAHYKDMHKILDEVLKISHRLLSYHALKIAVLLENYSKYFDDF